MLTSKNAEMLLGLASGLDGRTWPTEDDFRQAAASWAATLNDQWLTPEIAIEALKRHYRAEPRRITPADLLDHAQDIRRERLGRVRMPDPSPAMAGDPDLYVVGMAAAETAILAGQDPAAAMATAVSARSGELLAGSAGRPHTWSPLDWQASDTQAAQGEPGEDRDAE
jgi:hypothetical protein